MPIACLLLDRLHAAGLSDVTAVEPVEGGLAALAGVAARRNGPPLFVKSFADVPADDLFAAEAEGLGVLRERGTKLLPPRSACLTHGDLWAHNILATEDGRPPFAGLDLEPC